MFSEVLVTFFITTLAASILKCLSLAYKSKCSQVDVCCIKIIRDTEAEAKTDELELKHLPSSPSIKRHGSDSSL